MARRSEPYVEVVEGVTSVWPGDKVQRDDGWWRAVRISIRQIGNGPTYRSEIEWRPL